MKVFAFHPTTSYSGGVVLVAAKDEVQAEEFLMDAFKDDFHCEFSEAKKVEGLSFHGPDGVIRSDLYYE